MKAILPIVFLSMLLLSVRSHTYKCAFDEHNVDLRGNMGKAKPPSMRFSSDSLQGRLLVPTRGPIRIHLDTSAFNTTLPGANGATTTTTAKLNFILKSMHVTQEYLQGRLQVTQLSTLHSPLTCVDFNTSATDQTNGFNNTDLVIYVRYLTDMAKSYGATGKSCDYFPGVATSGSPDSNLQIGRPIIGRIIFNTYVLVDNEATLTNRIFQSVTSTALHETIHILGFDSTLYYSFLDPLTGYPYSVPQLNASNTVNVKRNSTNLLATPNVLAWAKDFFGCSTLQGMLLQNQDATGLGGGSHWQRTAMYDELMTATAFGAAKGISGLTMALLQDTGWYTVDSRFTESSNYGYKKGCSFLLDACYTNDTFGTFCNVATQNNISYCMSNFFGKAVCDNSVAMMADGCGMYGSYFNCVDDNTMDNGYQTYTHEVFGTGSFCVSSTLGTFVLPSNLQSRCYPYTCGIDSIVFIVGSYSITCLSTEVGVKKTISSLKGDLTCPSFTQFCTVSRKTCKNWCSQQGYCTGGVCNCLSGYSGEDCSKTNCSVGTFYSSQTSTCVNSCPTTTYANSFSGSCLACRIPCLSCVNSATNCLTCVSSGGKTLLLYNNQCYSSCPVLTFTSGSSCLSCDTVTAKCATCNGTASNCTSCNSGDYLSQPGSGSCATTCTVSPYLLQDVQNGVCVQTCPSNMITNPNNTCTVCSSGFISGGVCTATCPPQTYADSTLKACMPCHINCSSCIGPNAENCTACVVGSDIPYLMLRMCWAVCPKGFYAYPSSGKCQLCPADLNCSACSYNSSSTVIACTICQYGTFFQPINSTCMSSCLSNQFKNKWNNSCSSCDPTCTQCTGPTSNSCILCGSTQFLMTNTSGGYCVANCSTVGFLSNNSTKLCELCEDTCLTCNVSGICLTCKPNYYFYLGYCRFVCPARFYPEVSNNSCLACDSTCAYCFGASSSNCSACAGSLSLYNFSCLANCPNGMTANQWKVCFQSYISFAVLSILVILMS